MKKPSEFDYFRNTAKPEKNTTSYKVGRILGILLLTLAVLLTTTSSIALLKLLITYILA
nr:MAG: hypothetical protein [Bacteriophage sp.]